MATTVSQGPLTSQTPALFLINQGALYVQMFTHAAYSVFQGYLSLILEYRVARVTTHNAIFLLPLYTLIQYTGYTVPL